MSFSTACVNAEADAIGDALDNGYLRLYSGTAPAAADDLATGQMLAELRLAADAFPPANFGRLIAHPIRDTFVVASGKATWGRVLTAAGVTFFDGQVGAEIQLDHAALQAGAVVHCRSLTLTVSKS